MQYYSTNHDSQKVSLTQAITHSEAPDGGLYMPDTLPRLPLAFINNIAEMTDTEISYFVANTLFNSDISSSEIKKIGESSFSFPMPLVNIEPNIYALELFHGPTQNVKDIGARFSARILRALSSGAKMPLNVLISTNGNSGSAIANGYLGLEGVNVFVLYPRTTPRERAMQIAGMGGNVHAIRVNGNIDDCRRIIGMALADQKLSESMLLTSANSVNIARILPQIICYFIAYARLKKTLSKHGPIYFSVPCGNGGALLAGYFAKCMGLPAAKLIGACNANGAFARFFDSGVIDDCPPASFPTLAYSMDTCRPSNARRFLDICEGNVNNLRNDLIASVCSDDNIRKTISDVFYRTGYVLDPHSAVAYHALKEHLEPNACGIVMASGSPSRSAKTMAGILGPDKIEMPQMTASRSLREHSLAPTYPALKKYILKTLG